MASEVFCKLGSGLLYFFLNLTWVGEIFSFPVCWILGLDVLLGHNIYWDRNHWTQTSSNTHHQGISAQTADWFAGFTAGSSLIWLSIPPGLLNIFCIHQARFLMSWRARGLQVLPEIQFSAWPNALGSCSGSVNGVSVHSSSLGRGPHPPTSVVSVFLSHSPQFPWLLTPFQQSHKGPSYSLFFSFFF